MFIIRLESEKGSMQISSIMPPLKKFKAEVCESEFVNITSESESEAVDFGTDWRDRCKSLSYKYSHVLKNQVLTDVTLAVGETATPFHCHRLILAFGSPVFEAMFFGELAEKGDTVVIPDVDPEGFQQLVSFLYAHRCFLQNDVTAFKTYFAADKYCVTELKRVCEQFLCKCEVTPSNVWSFFENSLFLNSQDIKNRCLDVLKQNLKNSLEHSSFLSINLNTMESLLTLEHLNISEGKLLEHVIRWAEHQTQTDGGESFADILKPLLSNIRFAALKAKEFVELRHDTRLKEVLNENDIILILEHLINPDVCQLPDWCCTKKQRWCEPVAICPAVSESSKAKKKSSSKIVFCKRKFSPPSFSYSSSSSSSLSISSSSDSSSSSSESSD